MIELEEKGSAGKTLLTSRRDHSVEMAHRQNKEERKSESKSKKFSTKKYEKHSGEK